MARARPRARAMARVSHQHRLSKLVVRRRSERFLVLYIYVIQMFTHIRLHENVFESGVFAQ